MDPLSLNNLINGITSIVFGVTIIVSVAWLAVKIGTAIKQRADMRTRAEIYNRLIDKFGTAPEFIEFLKSDAGIRFIDENTVEKIGPLGKILTAVSVGLVLTMLGIGLVVTGNIFGNSLGGDLYIVLAVGGVCALMVGIGLLISAAISYRLCKAWGLVTAPKRQEETPI